MPKNWVWWAVGAAVAYYLYQQMQAQAIANQGPGSVASSSSAGA